MYELALVIPVYNGMKKLPKLLDSLLPQITHSVECIFIDDGSQDESYQFLCEATKEYDTIRVIQQQNQGVAATRNRGLDLTNSRYVWFIDGDDWLESHAIASIQAVLKVNQATMIHFNFIDHFLNGVQQRNAYFLSEQEVYHGHDFYQLGIEKFQYELKNMVWSFVIERKFLSEYALRFDESLPIFEDIVFLAQCYAENPSILILNQELYHYQQHPQSLTHTASNFQVQNYQSVIDALQFLANRTPQLSGCVKEYSLLLMSTVGLSVDSPLFKQLLEQNNHVIYAKYPKLYQKMWKLKKTVNRGARKLLRQPMIWR